MVFQPVSDLPSPKLCFDFASHFSPKYTDNNWLNIIYANMSHASCSVVLNLLALRTYAFCVNIKNILRKKFLPLASNSVFWEVSLYLLLLMSESLSFLLFTFTFDFL